MEDLDEHYLNDVEKSKVNIILIFYRSGYDQVQ